MDYLHNYFVAKSQQSLQSFLMSFQDKTFLPFLWNCHFFPKISYERVKQSGSNKMWIGFQSLSGCRFILFSTLLSNSHYLTKLE